MKLKFKNQAFQEAATAAVCDVFEGPDNPAEVVAYAHTVIPAERIISNRLSELQQDLYGD